MWLCGHDITRSYCCIVDPTWTWTMHGLSPVGFGANSPSAADSCAQLTCLKPTPSTCFRFHTIVPQLARRRAVPTALHHSGTLMPPLRMIQQPPSECHCQCGMVARQVAQHPASSPLSVPCVSFPLLRSPTYFFYVCAQATSTRSPSKSGSRPLHAQQYRQNACGRAVPSENSAMRVEWRYGTGSPRPPRRLALGLGGSRLASESSPARPGFRGGPGSVTARRRFTE